MKIVNRETFFSLPSGTIFSMWNQKSCNMEGLSEKAETGTILHSATQNTTITNLIDEWDVSGSTERFDLISDLENGSKEIAMCFDASSRCAEYDFGEDDLFCIWDKKDVAGLIAVLQRAL